VSCLPICSPELNADEMANADLEQAVTKLAAAHTRPHHVKATAKHLTSAEPRPERIKSHLQHAPVRHSA